MNFSVLRNFSPRLLEGSVNVRGTSELFKKVFSLERFPLFIRYQINSITRHFSITEIIIVLYTMYINSNREIIYTDKVIIYTFHTVE